MSIEARVGQIRWTPRPLLTQQSPANAFNVRMPEFWVRLTFRFRERGTQLPTPSSPQRIRVGLVQNVVHEVVRFEYGSQTVSQEWREPVCDWGSSAHQPFYSGPQTVELGRVGSRRVTAIQTSVMDIWHGPLGIAEATAGSAPPSAWARERDFELFIHDAPGSGFVYARRGTDWMTLASHSMVFQAWLVAIDSGGRRHVIAHSPPWSMAAWMRGSGQRSSNLPSSSSFGYQPESSGSYLASSAVLDDVLDPLPERFRSAPDTTHRFPFQPGAGPDLRVMPHAGERPPVFSGQASERGRRWVSAQGLSATTASAANQPSHP